MVVEGMVATEVGPVVSLLVLRLSLGAEKAQKAEAVRTAKLPEARAMGRLVPAGENMIV